MKTCDDLINALQKKPISVAVGANTWDDYRNGIMSHCTKLVLNHGVLVVGVTDNFWRVKNSWGTSWGEDGYIRLARGNTCGLCEKASYPNK